MIEPNNTVYPTFSCFDDALEFIEYVALEYKNEDTSFITLVHGLITGDDGKQHSHAWVEESGMEVAIFAGIMKNEKIYFYSPIKDYYEKYRVTETTRYTLEQSIENNIRTVNYGPWEPKYIALCGSGERAIIGGGEMKIGIIGKLPARKEQNEATTNTGPSSSVKNS